MSEHLPNAELDPSADPGHPTEPALAQELTGRLHCAACRYDLRGLTIKGTCPECGLAIQATLLSLVDPRAAEIQPIRSPKLVAVGLVAWSMGAFAAVVFGWAVWISGAIEGLVSDAAQHRLIIVGALCLAVSGVGALAIVRPHAGIPARRSIAAALGVALYPLAVKFYIDLGAIASAGSAGSLLNAWSGEIEAMPWRRERLLLWLILAIGAWCLRGNLRLLATRSLTVRAERVDRQTIAGAVAAVGIAAVGDGLDMLAPFVGNWGGVIMLIGEVLVGLGAVLLTLAMGGIVVDTLRLMPAVLQRPLGMADVLGNGDTP